MKSIKLLYIGLLYLSLLFLPRLDAATFQYEDISIASQATLPGQSNHGYFEYSFIVQNSSPSRSHQVTLELPFRDNGYGARIYPLSRTANIPPRSKMMMRLYQPFIALPSNNIVRVVIDGSDRSLANPLTYSPINLHYYHNNTVFMITKSAMSHNPPEIENASGNMYMLSNVPVSEWSDNWLAFSRYPMIIITSEDFDMMSSGTRTALINYAECGGILVSDGELNIPSSWKKLNNKSGPWNIYSAGFGKIITTGKTFKKIAKRDWNRIYHMAAVNNGALQTNMSVNEANNHFPVVKKLNISPGIIFFIMLVFAFLIGPVNIFILSRKKRKIWLLWTVPAGALLFTIVLLIYALSSETWGGHTRSRTLTVLDENTRRAISLGRLAYFYPIPPGGGLMFSPWTEVGTIGVNQSNRVYSVDWTNGQHLRSGWFVAKTPCQLILRKNEPRRERLEIQRHKKSISITNGLGVHIESLHLWDFDNELYTATNIKPGAKVELGRIKIKSIRNNDSLKLGFYDSMIPAPDFKLMPGSYVAKLQSNPFVEPGRKFSANHKGEATLIGIMRQEDAK